MPLYKPTTNYNMAKRGKQPEKIKKKKGNTSRWKAYTFLEGGKCVCVRVC